MTLLFYRLEVVRYNFLCYTFYVIFLSAYIFSLSFFISSFLYCHLHVIIFCYYFICYRSSYNFCDQLLSSCTRFLIFPENGTHTGPAFTDVWFVPSFFSVYKASPRRIFPLLVFLCPSPSFRLISWPLSGLRLTYSHDRKALNCYIPGWYNYWKLFFHHGIVLSTNIFFLY